MSGQGVPSDSLFKAYTQDTANNCASIALIKANLNAFGLYGIYKEKVLDKITSEYTLKDGSKILITKAEIDFARKKFSVDTSNATSAYLRNIVKTSVVCYALMGKRFGIEFPDLGSSSYEKNIDFISDVSFDVRFGIYLLGTADYFIFLTRWANIRGKKGVVVWSPHHTVFASEKKCDMRGDASNFYRGTKSYIRFWGRMYIDPTELVFKP
jgi:hypothetical protein